MVHHCSLCGINCATPSKFEQHCSTRKHLNAAYKADIDKNKVCKCGNLYKHRESLLRHQKKCAEFKNQVIVHEDQKKNAVTNSVTDGSCTQNIAQYNDQRQYNDNRQSWTCDTNMTNPMFNFNIYLNEQCRDAVCIEDFCKEMINKLRVTLGDSHINFTFVDNKETFNELLTNLQTMQPTRRPIQSYQGEIVEKSQDDWQALSLDKLNQHVTGVTSKVNWDAYSSLPEPTSSNEQHDNMVALKSATEIHPPLRHSDINRLKKTTEVQVPQPSEDN